MSTSADQNTMHIECWCCKGSGCQIADVGGFYTIPDCSESFLQSACVANFESYCPTVLQSGINQPVATCPSADGGSTAVGVDQTTSSVEWYETPTYIGILCGGIILLTLFACVSYRYYSTRGQTTSVVSPPPNEPTMLV
jgi:hypothetical protein